MRGWLAFGLMVGCGADDIAADDLTDDDVAADEGASCAYDGVTQEHGESFDATDGCNTCTCDDGYVGCSELGCQDTSR